MNLYSIDEFYARDPAPGTTFVEIDGFYELKSNTSSFNMRRDDVENLLTPTEHKNKQGYFIVINWGGLVIS